MTPNLLPFTRFVKPALDRFCHGTGLSFAGMAKIVPWCLARRDKLLAKVLGTLRSAQGWPAGLRHQRFLLIPATVGCKVLNPDKTPSDNFIIFVKRMHDDNF